MSETSTDETRGAAPGGAAVQEGEGGGRRSLLAPEVERWPLDPAQPIVRMRNVWKYGFDGEPVIQNLSLDIPTGKTTVIIGESGSGKSVLLKLMNGLIRADKGTVELFGQDLGALPERQLYELRKRTSMVLQNYALFDSMNVLSNIGFSLVQNTKMAQDEIDRRARELLEMLELSHAEAMVPASLSGGMKKRVSFARAVITQPELVFFDEPTTGLDPVMIEFVDQLIIKMQRRFQITSVIISHDISSVFNLADQIAMLSDGTIIVSGTPEEIRRNEDARLQRFISVGGSGRLSAGGDGEEDGEACADPTQRAGFETLIELVDVHKSFGTNQVLKGVNLKIPRREVTVIIGGSGSGKSVIIKHIIGLFAPTSGRVLFDGQDLSALDTRQLQAVRARIGMLFQGAALFDSMSVFENVSFPLVERGGRVDHKQVERRVREVLERLHLEGIRDMMPPAISAGQKKRVGLARAIVTRPEVMIYDEPTTGQDPVMIRYVDDMIAEAHDAFELTSIVISHDMQSTFRVADYIAMLHKGEILAFGTPDDVRASTNETVQKFIFAGAQSDEAET